MLVRDLMGEGQYDYDYDKAYIFHSKDCRKVKILHHDINGFVMYEKWFDDRRSLKPRFMEKRKSHKISRETMILFMSSSVQTEMAI